MSAADTQPVVPALPSGARLLHIGLPKTGTTTLQRGAAVNRSALADHGVCYPGTGFNHRDPVAALMRRPLGWAGRGATMHSIGVWNRLLNEVQNSDAERAFISHEFCCESDDDQARRFIQALGPDRIHVAITLRGFAELLPSVWQQYVKSGSRRAFQPWLQTVLRRGAKQQNGAPHFYRRHDQAAIVQRWVRLLGPDRVTVVLADKRRPDQLIHTFEDLLDLPRHAMASRPVGGYAANRGLSAPEVELVRRINGVMHRQSYDWRRYTTLIRHGLIARMQEQRRPGPREPALLLPAQSARKAVAQGGRFADAIAAIGCRVVGDLSQLSAPVPTVQQMAPPARMPADAAVEAACGVLSAADGRGAFFGHAAGGLEGRRTRDPRLERWTDPERAGEILDGYRSTRHLTWAAMAGVAGHRGIKAVQRRFGRDSRPSMDRTDGSP